ncbi:beta-propeller domain-containing protein [Wukongibacter sp. M2B1]|uniref:beta-propeller domain-containing protein n=1 Tax=Wukongibacter sp. M2B1 TaxID=3088895 RepID=UPI003D7BEFE4
MRKVMIIFAGIITIFIAVFTLSFSQNNSFSKQEAKTEISMKNININESAYIPVRELFEKLNFSVEWVSKERAVLMYDDENFIKLQLDDDYFIFNGEVIKHKNKPIILDNKFYVSQDFLNSVFEDSKYDNARELLVFKTLDIFRDLGYLPSVENREKLEKLLSFSDFIYKEKLLFDRDDLVFTEASKNESTDINMSYRGNYKSKSSESSHSETNIQVKGVDEGDIVKTDGSYIYTLSNNKLYIVNSQREEFKLVNTLNFDNYDPMEFYIKDNRIITIGYFYGLELNKAEDEINYKIIPIHSNPLSVHIYDISNKGDISLIRNIELDGNYLSSRLIDNSFYLVANKNIYYKDKDPRPFYMDSIDKKRTLIDYEDIKYFPESIYNSYIITLGLDLENLDSSEIDVNAYLGGGNNMYVSTENMYISQDKFRFNIYSSDIKANDNRSTSIFKFKLDKGNIIYSTKGEVPGNVLNQFSMDEYKSNFRIATTKDDLWDGSNSKSTSNVYVLDRNLKLLGKTEDLAPGERIYSVRFMGDKVYVVTFRQIDPFYVIDLQEPEAPRVLGYLKIPGYSSYLHPYDENHIIGIGMDTIEDNGRVINGGVKLSMFDITDYSNPIELDKIVIGGRGSYTDILQDHKSLLFSKERNILSFPIYASNYDSNTYKHSFETQGAFVFGIDKDYKFDLRGNISHLKNSDRYSEYIRRILFIDNNLYTISNSKIKLSDFDSLEDIKDLYLDEEFFK